MGLEHNGSVVPPIGRWKVSYLGGFPGKPKPVNGVYLTLFANGVMLQSRKMGSPFIPYNRIRRWDVVKGPGRYSLPITDAIFDGRNIRIEYLDPQNQLQILHLQMFETLNTQKNAMICQDMLIIMRNHGIFIQFIPDTDKSASNVIFEQIERLSALHQSGALTDEEFQTKKTELLKKI